MALSLTLLIISCKKNEEMSTSITEKKNLLIENQQISRSLTVNKQELKFKQNLISSSEQGRSALSLDFNETPQSAAEIFQGIDPNYLQSIINGPNSGDAEVFMQNLSNQVRDYLLAAYNFDIYEEAWNVPSENVALGLMFAAFETFPAYERTNADEIKKHSYLARNDSFDCFIGGVTGILGLRDITSIYNDFVRGVSARTIATTLRFMMRRVATAFTVAVTIIEVGDCLGWW